MSDLKEQLGVLYYVCGHMCNEHVVRGAWYLWLCSPHWQISVPGTAPSLSDSTVAPRQLRQLWYTGQWAGQPASPGSHRRGGLKNPSANLVLHWQSLAVTTQSTQSQLYSWHPQWPQERDDNSPPPSSSRTFVSVTATEDIGEHQTGSEMVSLDMVSTPLHYFLSSLPLSSGRENVANLSPPRIETCKACQRIVLRKIVYMFSQIQLGH